MSMALVTNSSKELSDDDKFIERHAERILSKIMLTESSVHTVKLRNFDTDIVVHDEDQGNPVTLSARNICNIKTVRAFLATKELQNLTVVAYRVDDLAKEYSLYLRTTYRRKNKESKYYLIRRNADLDTFDGICWIAIGECIGWNKRELKAFIDDRAAVLTDLGHCLRRVRGYAHEAPNHIVKHKPEEEGIRSTIDLFQERITQMVEDFASRDLPNFLLTPLPEGVPTPLQLPVGNKQKRGQSNG